MRKGKVFFKEHEAGVLMENEEGFSFTYSTLYLKSNNAEAISLTLPLQEAPFRSTTMFPFFDGLIPEGWLLEIAEKNWKINSRDRMGLLLVCCKDCIGAVSIIAEE
jgi:serine/threonine-protein kinase HipA